VLLALTNHLHCTGDHAASWLVARADAAVRGWMVEGELGCPMCDVTRGIRGGILSWDPAVAAQPVAPLLMTGPDDDSVIRLAALLALVEGSAPYVLCGDMGRYAVALGAVADAPLVLLDPPDDSAAGLATIIRGAPRMPFADRSVRGIALDAVHASAERVAYAVRVLAPGGRMVAGSDLALPSGIRELARDDRHWVGERVVDHSSMSAPVAIGRAPAAPRRGWNG